VFDYFIADDQMKENEVGAACQDKNTQKMAVFWEAAPCSLVDTDRRFRGAY
jgi:hypothetical protein